MWKAKHSFSVWLMVKYKRKEKAKENTIMPIGTKNWGFDFFFSLFFIESNGKACSEENTKSVTGPIFAEEIRCVIQTITLAEMLPAWTEG